MIFPMTILICYLIITNAIFPRLEVAEMWCYRRLLRIIWTEKGRNKSILDELENRRELLAQIIKRKMAFFGHSCRNNKCNLVKTCIF